MPLHTDTFPIDIALDAMGFNAKRWTQHRSQGKIRFLADTDNAHNAQPNGWGRGQKLHLSVYAILQGAIALRAIDCGVEVERAYAIAERVVWSGLTGISGAESEWRQRLPGPAFKRGQTWIAIAQYAEIESEIPDFVVVSDSDPRFQDDKLSPFQMIEALLPEMFGGSPFVMMRLNGIWEQIAKILDLPIDAIKEGLD